MRPISSLKRYESCRLVSFLPNLLTTINLLCAFLALIAISKGVFSKVPLYIYLAMLADGLDGRIARFTGNESSFGAHYDSLVDAITFGATPGFFAYKWRLYLLGKIGFIIAFFYVAATVIRLARFGVHGSTGSRKNYFTGLPCTLAAGGSIGTIWLISHFLVPSFWYQIILLITMIFLGILMLSNMRFYSWKGVSISYRYRHIIVAILVLIVSLVSLAPLLIASIAMLLYIVISFFFNCLLLLKQNVQGEQ